MSSTLTGFFAGLSAISYTTAWIMLAHALHNRKSAHKKQLFTLIAVALICHALTGINLIFNANHIRLSLFQVFSVVLVMMNSIVLISGIRLPLQNLFLALLPLSLISLSLSFISASETTLHQQLSLTMVSHILLSIIAYSLLTIATLQGLLIAYQYRRLKHHDLKSVMGVFPPLQTMETLLFDLLWAGFVLLSLSMATGFIFLDDIFAQHLSHKLFFSVSSWVIYAIILSGRVAFGWRGQTAIRWVLVGFVMLLLAYFGSELVREFIV